MDKFVYIRCVMSTTNPWSETIDETWYKHFPFTEVDGLKVSSLKMDIDRHRGHQEEVFKKKAVDTINAMERC